MRESEVEKYLREQVEAHGGLCEKFITGRVGVPDRLITWPDLGMFLVETKRPDGPGVRANQERDHRRRRRLGMEVAVIHTKEQVDEFCQRLNAARFL